jgi:hypothetical protein
MLPAVFENNTTLLTFDRTIVSDNTTSITIPNPGIIVIQKKKPHPPMTARIARAIIENFKKRVPSWPKIDWSMVYAEIDEDEIYVAPLTDPDTSHGQPFPINDEAADTNLTQYVDAIHENLKERFSSPNQ